MRRPIAIKPILISKLNTAAQIILAASLLAMKALEFPAPVWAKAGFYIVAALTLLSLVAYFRQWVRHLSP
jgi:cardiolipin synthase